jgi:hypothetical protein
MHFDSAERSNRFENDESAARVTRQVAELEIVLGDHHLEPSVAPAKPNRRNERGAVLSIRGQNRRRGSLHERAHVFDRKSGHLIDHALSTIISVFASRSRKKNNLGTVPSPPISSASTSTPFAFSSS